MPRGFSLSGVSLIEKPVVHVNEWQCVTFGSMPREDVELFDLSM
jgi:hypothetical protein